MATIIGIIIIGLFLVIVFGSLLKAIVDLFLHLLGWFVVLGLIVLGIIIGGFYPPGYILTAIGVCLLAFSGGAAE